MKSFKPKYIYQKYVIQKKKNKELVEENIFISLKKSKERDF